MKVEEGEDDGEGGRDGDEEDGADVPGDAPLGPPDVAGPERDNVTHQAGHVSHGSGQQRDIWQNDQSSGYCNVYHLTFIVISTDCHSTVQYSIV